MFKYSIYLFVFLSLVFISSAPKKVALEHELDVLSYQVVIKPDIRNKSIEGNVFITFAIRAGTKQVSFNCGSLVVSAVKGTFVKSYQQQDGKLTLFFNEQAIDVNTLQIFYKGNPSKGVIFQSAPQQVYTVFHTSEWLICNDVPSDKAKIKIDLLIPDHLVGIASGVFLNKESIEDSLIVYSWDQQEQTPAYTYGFVVGTFNEYKEQYANLNLDYYGTTNTSHELKRIFDKTGDMISFFEEKSGVKYFQNSYTQILVGSHYQEMSGFTVLKNSYGALVLKDSTETNLISHELAHQWWGNSITCANWNHIWLNEAFATYMSAAYNEHRFGRGKYMKDITSYKEVYEKIKAKGADKPLVFTDWTNPSQDDRNLVYFKGAYVLHLLREELGDKLFWKGIKEYSLKYYGKTVTTKEFKEAMEKSTTRDLSRFFNQWIY